MHTLLKRGLLLGLVSLGLAGCTLTVQRTSDVRPSVSPVSSNLITNLSPDRGEGASYYVGQNVRLRLSTRAPGYVTLVSLDPDGYGSVLIRGAYVSAGTTVFPRAQDGVNYQLRSPRGLQRVRAIFTTARPTSTVIFSGHYDVNGFANVTSNSVRGYGPQQSDIVETYFYIR